MAHQTLGGIDINIRFIKHAQGRCEASLCYVEGEHASELKNSA